MMSLTHPMMWELIIKFYGVRKEYYTPWCEIKIHLCYIFASTSITSVSMSEYFVTMSSASVVAGRHAQYKSL